MLALSFPLFVAGSTSSRRDPFCGFDAGCRREVVHATAMLCEVERVELARRLRPMPLVTQQFGWSRPPVKKGSIQDMYIYIYICIYI